MSACTNPDCGGTVEDGYCMVCGRAAAPAQPPVTGSASGGPWSAVSPTAGAARTRRTSGRSARGRLGAGLVEIPPEPYRDPPSATLSDPQVPESRRFPTPSGYLPSRTGPWTSWRTR
jgi:serine/threonine-protein kinase PknG